MPLSNDTSSDARKGAAGPNDDAVEKFVRTVAVPAVKQLGFSGVVGVCAGAAAKSLGRKAAIGVGIGVVGVQALAYLGYIDVKWDRVEDAATKALDVNGDGEVNEEDAVEAWRAFRKVATYGMASAAGFSSGVVIGLRYL